MDLRAVEAHLAQLQHPQLPRYAQNLHEQRFDLLAQALAEVRNRIVVRMRVGRHVAHRHRVKGRALQLAAREDPRRASIEQQGHHHRRVKRVRSAAAVRLGQFAEIQLLHDLDDKPCQMIARQPLLHRRGQQVRGVAVHAHKPSAHPLLHLHSNRFVPELPITLSRFGQDESPTGC